jgi:hypothetical protein
VQAARLQKIETESTDPLRLQASTDEVSRLRAAATLQQEIASATQERDQGPAKMDAMATTGPKEAALSLKGPNVADLMSQITKLEEVLLLACSDACTNVIRKSSVVQTYIHMHILCMHSLVQIHKHKDLRLCVGR